ncbi:glucosaminidase domain-containing protein [Thermoflavimicrobium daqui]|jgi:beta-N-acetylglucosaminidase|uniref:Mannosyl-glycoprotein endo-beta-N-acetylglucosamidase-like domain-containing protein n=1 Tax=Thermoflavimicrobium daqui TaxID=2137476 RepID=A0A364K582_9BACL|nr:glucosaminidase domain-containing protein [Thermoflavimicrobium daqui]RAL24540.1 hypothetical protein DL897_09530 [Thermoflavimicrobium daqui]
MVKRYAKFILILLTSVVLILCIYLWYRSSNFYGNYLLSKIINDHYDNYLLSKAPNDHILCRTNQRIIPIEELDKKLKNKGVFKNKGAAFINAGKNHNVDPTLVAAIALFETGYGTSNAVKNYNNPGGLMDPDNPMEFQRFETLEEGINAMTANLYRNYISLGLETPKEIAPKYAPVGAKNDLYDTNGNWAPTVTKFINYLGGLSQNCDETKTSRD